MKAKLLLKRMLGSKFSRDTFWLTCAQFVVLITGFLLNLGIERYYGIDELGYISQSISFYMIFSSLFALGLNNTTIKKISEFTESRKDQNVIFSQNLFLTFVISTVLSLVVYLTVCFLPSFFSSDKLVELLKFHMIGVPFFCMNKQFGAYYSGLREQGKFAIQRLIRWSGIGFLFCLTIWFGFELTYIIYSFVLIEILLFIYNVFQNYQSFELRLEKARIKNSLVFGMKSYSAEIVAVFNSNLDLIILGYMLSSKDVGIYSFLIFFVKSLYIFPGIIMQNISPIVSNLWGKGELSELQRKISAVGRVNLIVAIVQFISLIIFYYIIVNYFKISLINSFHYFIIASLGAFVFSTVSWSGSMLIMSGKLRVNFYRTVIVLIISITNICVFTYYSALFGACLAIAINGLVNLIIIRFLIKKEMGIKIIL